MQMYKKKGKETLLTQTGALATSSIVTLDSHFIVNLFPSVRWKSSFTT